MASPSFLQSIHLTWLTLAGQSTLAWASLNLTTLFRDSSIVCLYLFLLRSQFTMLVATRPKINHWSSSLPFHYLIQHYRLRNGFPERCKVKLSSGEVCGIQALWSFIFCCFCSSGLLPHRRTLCIIITHSTITKEFYSFPKTRPWILKILRGTCAMLCLWWWEFS